MQQPDPAQLQRRCDTFNAAHPIGTRVRYFHVIGERKNSKVYKTRTIAQVLSGHTAVIWLEGKPGCVCLDAIEVLPAAAVEDTAR